MPANYEWEVFNVDQVEDAFVASVREGVIIGAPTVQVTGKFPLPTSHTPSVKLTLTTREVQGQRHHLNPQKETRFQPYNVWMFTLAAEVTTQREQNGALHRELIARTRLALQLYKLAASWDNALAPYHTVIDIGELAASELVTDDQATTDSTTLNFSGQIQIDATAWPITETTGPTEIPANLTLPFITGPNPPQVGDTLTANPGTYTNGPYTTAHEWVMAPGPVQTGNTILIESEEWIGVSLYLREVATNAIGPSDPPSESASYPPVEPA